MNGKQNQRIRQRQRQLRDGNGKRVSYLYRNLPQLSLSESPFLLIFIDPSAKPSNLPCQYHRATFAPTTTTIMPGSLVVIECLGPGIPTSAIYRVAYNEKPLHLVFYVQNNTRLRERVGLIAMPQIKTFPVLISGGYHAQVRLFLPPGLREDEITRYPLILHV